MRRYIETAGELGLMVILRPGPYVCAEWEFGGYPWWLQNIPGMEIRRDNPEFLKCTKRYLDRLYEEVGDLLVTRGGPIIMVQAENEFGSYVAQRNDIPLEEHKRYNAAIRRQLPMQDSTLRYSLQTGAGCLKAERHPGLCLLPMVKAISKI